MKKIIFTLLVAFMSSITFMACTEDEIAPTNQSENNGGAFEAPVTR